MFILLIPTVFIACDCTGIADQTPCSVLTAASRPETQAVFVGKARRVVVEFEKDPSTSGPSWGRRFVEFDVSENFHGAPHSTFAVEFIGACDFPFIPGIEYLVFADWWTASKSWTSSMCGRSGIALQKHGEIEVLRAAAKGPILIGVVKGSRHGMHQPELVEGATVHLKSVEQTVTATTSWFGDFVFSGLKGGEFELSIDAPGWRFSNPRNVALGSRCHHLDIVGAASQFLSPPLPQHAPVPGADLGAGKMQ